MDAYTKLKAALVKVTESCGGIPISEGLAKARILAIKEVEKALIAKGVWDKVKDENPGKFITITQDSLDETVINIYVSDYTKGLLK
jgi:hypothetical protein